MRTTRSFIRITRAAVCMSALILGGTTPVSASDPETVQGSQASFEKYLIMDARTDVPDVTFTFTMEPGEAQEGDASGNLPVYAGDDQQNVSGFPSIGTAAFVRTDNTSQNADGIPADLDADQKYARKNVSVDFTNVTFKKAGIYRYVITETSTDRVDIHNDKDSTRILDVWVQYESFGLGQRLAVSGYVLHNGEPDSKVARDTEPEAKSQGFVNEYITHDLTLKKTVAGNQSSPDEYFRLTLNISGAPAGTEFHVDQTHAQNEESYSNPDTIAVNENGTVEQEFWLRHDQYVVIHGLPANVSYSVKEDKENLDKEGYRASAEITGDTENNAGPIAMNEDTTVSDDSLTADTSVVYINEKEGIVPTGVSLDVLPETLVFLLGIIGFIGLVWCRTRRNME